MLFKASDGATCCPAGEQVKLIDAGFIWTEPHSRRLKLKLTIQKEVMNGAILQQTFVVDVRPGSAPSPLKSDGGDEQCGSPLLPFDERFPCRSSSWSRTCATNVSGVTPTAKSGSPASRCVSAFAGPR